MNAATETEELLNLWNETPEQCARRMLAGAQLTPSMVRGMTPREIDELGTARARARQHAEKIAGMAREDAAPCKAGRIDPEFYVRVAAWLADG